MTTPKPKSKSKPKSKPSPKPNADLFSGAGSPAAPNAGGTALRVSGRAKAASHPLSAGQKRFNKLLESIDKLQAEIAEAQVLADTYRQRYATALTPLREQQIAAMRRMALRLDERLSRKGLTPAQRRDLIEMLCGLCELLAASGDKAMEALHDKYSAQSLHDKHEEAANRMRAMMKSALGDQLDVDLEDESLDPMERLEALLRATEERVAHEQEQEAERQQTAKARKKPSVAQLKAGQEQADAQTVLRQLYRQLVSALHPDRERDPAEHRRKTALMSEANAAYGRQDLVALLHIQQRIEQMEPDAIFDMPEKKIAAMATLLKQQADALQAELHGRQEQLREAFNLDFYQTPNNATLQDNLALQEELLHGELAQMDEDLKMVQDDAGLKSWLKNQKQLARQNSFF